MGDAAAARPATSRLSAEARRRLEAAEGGPLLINDWVRAVFIHYEVAPAALRPVVPFELDLRGGKAYVSLVAFAMRRFRPRLGGRLTEWVMAPFTNQGFLNVRTYVKHDGEPGIFFLAEWLSSRLSTFIGPRTFGLPFRFGRLDFDHRIERGRLEGRVTGKNDSGAGTSRFAHLAYAAEVDPAADCRPCEEYSLTEFLVERYSAFTDRRGVRRRFRIWHEPWPLTPIDVEVSDAGLLEQTGRWMASAQLIGGHYSPGVADVWMGRPCCINGRFCNLAAPRIERNKP